MNKAQLVELIAKKTGLSKRSVSQAMELFIDTVKGELSHGRKVTMTGFGTFLLSHRSARTGVNPQTGKIIRISAMSVPRFKAGKELKAMIK
jgi:DNA-binding protein HU-beta